MAKYQITLDSKVLHQLFMTKSKDSGVSALLESVLNQILPNTIHLPGML